jgi:hypothetical protein
MRRSLEHGNAGVKWPGVFADDEGRSSTARLLGSVRAGRLLTAILAVALTPAGLGLQGAHRVQRPVRIPDAWSFLPGLQPDPLYILKAAPVPSFSWFPAFPHTNERVSLVSTSTDLTSPIRRFAWDVSDNGPFGAFVAGGPATATTFPTPASHVVRLRVSAGNGLSAIVAEAIRMSPPPVGVMQPFPIVRIAGTNLASGIKISVLAVKAPAGARITVGCRGSACPAKSVSRAVASSRQGPASIRFRRFERFLRPRMVLEIRVSRSGEIGDYTAFSIRLHRLPTRVDSCLDSAGVRPIVCPTS